MVGLNFEVLQFYLALVVVVVSCVTFSFQGRHENAFDLSFSWMVVCVFSFGEMSYCLIAGRGRVVDHGNFFAHF